MIKRGFVVQDVVHVLKSGFHDERFDSWSNKFSSWKYNIRGTTIDGNEIRVVLSLQNRCIIVTVIDA